MLYRTASCLLRAHVDGVTPDVAARSLYGREHGLDTVLRAASSPATLTGSTWASPVAQNLIRGDLIQPLTALSAAANLMQSGVKVDLTGVASITVPSRQFSPSTAGGWIAEGMPIPARSPTILPGPKLVPRKLGVLTGYTREQVESSAIEAFVRAAITEATAALLDERMFSNIAADAYGPAGILGNATTVPPSTSGEPWAISTDIGKLVEALALYGAGLEPVLIAAPAQAASLRMWRQESFYDIYPSLALSAGTVIAVEAPSFVSWIDAAPLFSVATGAVIHEEDTTPTDIVAGGATSRSTRSACA
jgi:hypothetical protein